MQQVRWAEFELQELFESSNGDFDIQKVHINNLGNYVITAGLSNNGIIGKTDVKAKIFEANTITVDMFGNAFYRQFCYKMVTHARVFSLKTNFGITQKQGMFFASALHFLKYKFGYENMCSWAKVKNEKIQLPIRDGEIDFDFMENFIAELNAQRLAELNAYLSVTGLKDYTLTIEEQQALKKIEQEEIIWAEFELQKLFIIEGTKSLDSNAIDFVEKGINFVGRTFENNGIQGFIEERDFEPNSPFTITATVIGNYKYVKYQKEEYYCSQNINKLTPRAVINKWNEKVAYFFVANIQKFVSLYDGQQGGYKLDDIRRHKIKLPINKNSNLDKISQIDFDFMETFISAVQKLVIKNVVLYADREIATTEQIIQR